jgi:hypothetical protein
MLHGKLKYFTSLEKLGKGYHRFHSSHSASFWFQSDQMTLQTCAFKYALRNRCQKGNASLQLIKRNSLTDATVLIARRCPAQLNKYSAATLTASDKQEIAKNVYTTHTRACQQQQT